MSSLRRSPTDREIQADDPTAIRLDATRAQARREHSTQELKRKLIRKGYHEAAVAQVIETMSSKGLVSNSRFTASFVTHHAGRGQGPARIRAELRSQGVPDAEIDGALDSAEVDWIALACRVRKKRFGAAVPRAMSERAKQARFLQYRGFGADEVRAAFAASPGEDAPFELDAD
jgi:regulatory protein